MEDNKQYVIGFKQNDIVLNFYDESCRELLDESTAIADIKMNNLTKKDSETIETGNGLAIFAITDENAVDITTYDGTITDDHYNLWIMFPNINNVYSNTENTSSSESTNDTTETEESEEDSDSSDSESITNE